jgi:hypothetical protein
MSEKNTKQGNSIERTLGRIESTLDSFKDIMAEDKKENKEAHEDLLKKQDNLCIHVNHENELLCKRMTDIEFNGSKALQNFVKVFDEILLKQANEQISQKQSITNLEKKNDAEASERRGQIKIYKISTAILAIVVTALSIANVLGLI